MTQLIHARMTASITELKKSPMDTVLAPVRAGQQGLAPHTHGAEQAVRSIQDVFEGAAADRDEALIGLHVERGRVIAVGLHELERRLVPGIGHLQQDLVEAEGVARRQQFRAGNEVIGDREVAAPRIGDRDAAVHGTRGARRDGRQRLDGSALDHLAVTRHLVAQAHGTGEIGEIEVVPEP